MIHYEFVNEDGRLLADKIKASLTDFNQEAIVFVGALGICVRKILPLVHDKYSDPAVVCVDATGRWVIPVISGHVGGANDLARRIALITSGEAVVTTQSDNLNLWPLDTLAPKFGWCLQPLPHDDMNRAIAAFVNRKPVALILEWNDSGTCHMEATLPCHVALFHSFDDFVQCDRSFSLVIIVSPYVRNVGACLSLHYVPRVVHLGVGCQRNAPVSAAEQILDDVCSLGFCPESIASIGTIDMKQDEPMLAHLCRILPDATLSIYSASQLAQIDVPNPSDKVFDVTGCYGVAEAAAMMHGRRLVVTKQKGSVDGFGYTFALSLQQGHIEIVGAGPGAPDLISVRGREFLQRADLILYAGSLVPKELTLCAKKDAVVRSSADMDLDAQFEIIKEFYDRGALVVRLHTGDPCIYGAIQEQMAYFDAAGMDYHITPGISSFLAAAAELRSQFTIPEKCQTIILTRGEGRTPMPEREKLHLLAQHRSTMCIFLSAAIVDSVQSELLAGGYPADTPVAVCYRLTWRDQRVYRGTLSQLADIVHDNNLSLTTMIVVGEAIDNRHGTSRLYDSNFSHLYRISK